MSVFSKSLGFITILILITSCAQVGTISGGPVDDVAPEVKKMTPENKTVRFTGNEFEIEFEDFIKLNNPTQTITVIPPDFNVQTEIKGKTLFLNWEGQLKENTTYSIFLNKTVQDITEGNDSIMQIVFSTGDFLDSISYTAFVKDALTAAPTKGTMVGLFEAKDSLKPMYFAETNANGQATFNYLKPGTYFVRSFDDVNKDLSISKTERVGFHTLPVQLDTSVIDSLPMSLFTPTLPANVTTFSFSSPGAFVLGSNRSLKNAKITLNDIVLSETDYSIIAEDSLLLFYQPKEEKSFRLTVNNEFIDDTATVRLTDASKNKPLTIVPPKGNSVNPKEFIRFTVLDKIEELDTSKIDLVSLPDSVSITDYTVEIISNQLAFNVNSPSAEKILFAFDQNALKGKTGAQSTQSTVEIKRLKANELGVLNVDLSAYQEAIVLEVITEGKTIQTISLNEAKTHQLSNLKPGDYTFKVIIDSNNNGKWDTGDFPNEVQPEEIQLFTEPTKVRANWEIELIILPK